MGELKRHCEEKEVHILSQPESQREQLLFQLQQVTPDFSTLSHLLFYPFDNLFVDYQFLCLAPLSLTQKTNTTSCISLVIIMCLALDVHSFKMTPRLDKILKELECCYIITQNRLDNIVLDSIVSKTF